MRVDITGYAAGDLEGGLRDGGSEYGAADVVYVQGGRGVFRKWGEDP